MAARPIGSARSLHPVPKSGVKGGRQERGRAQIGRPTRHVDDRLATENPALRIAAANCSSLAACGSKRMRASPVSNDTAALRTPGSAENEGLDGACTAVAMHAFDLEAGCLHVAPFPCSVPMRCLVRSSESGGCSTTGVQGTKDRAGTQCPTTWTGGDQFIECSPHVLKLHYLAVDLLALDQGLPSNIPAIGRRVGAQRKKVLDFTQGKAQFLGLPNEANTINGSCVVVTKAAIARARWLLDQAAAFVEANGFDANACEYGSAAYGESGGHGTSSRHNAQLRR